MVKIVSKKDKLVSHHPTYKVNAIIWKSLLQKRIPELHTIMSDTKNLDAMHTTNTKATLTFVNEHFYEVAKQHKRTLWKDTKKLF